jgi:hypothetical protein
VRDGAVRLRLHLLGVLGAAVAASGDGLACLAARGWYPVALVALSVVAYASCGVIWYHMAKITAGSFAPAAVSWEVAGTMFFWVLALALTGRQRPLEWAGLALVLLGALLRALA